MKRPFVAVQLIPTGIGAAIGGYAGDGMTSLRLLSSVCDTVITHPNVANAACFQDCPDNVLYVEGLALDYFASERWRLKPVHQNAIGVILDAGISDEMKTLHLNTIDATQTTYGCTISRIIETTDALQLRIEIAASGRSCGDIGNIETLYNAIERLLEQAPQTTAIALCCKIPIPEDDANYQDGVGVDPIAGLEAMLSHAVVQRFQLPAANAPIFDWADAEPVRHKRLNPRTAAEFITPTFLPCVLTGLQRAPQYDACIAPSSAGINSLCFDDVSVVICPASALGNRPVLAALAKQIPVLAIANNTTSLGVTAEQLGAQDGVVLCENYLEAIGHCVALKAGVSPKALLTTNATAVEPLVVG